MRFILLSFPIIVNLQITVSVTVSALLAFLSKNTCSDYRLQCHSQTRTRFCHSGPVQGVSNVSWLFTVTSLLLAVLRIRITLMHIRILLFSFMRIRIRILPFTLIGNASDPTFQFDPDPSTHLLPDLDPLMFQNDPLRLPPFPFHILMRIRVRISELRIRIFT
jgi:hypothetical protein